MEELPRSISVSEEDFGGGIEVSLKYNMYKDIEIIMIVIFKYIRNIIILRSLVFVPVSLIKNCNILSQK